MFTRLAVNEMGPVALTALRSAIAALTLMPVMLWSGLWPEFRRRWPHIMVIGLISTALPFCLIAVSTQYTSAGFASIVNSFTPIFSALIAWLWIAILGILCTGLAFILYFHLLGHIGVSNTVLVTYLAPVFAMLWGGIFLDETITLKMLLGTAFILGGITLTTGLLKHVLRGRSPRQALEEGNTDA